MARIIHGTITVPVYSPTENAGEYTVTGATYDNQADTTGNGTADLAIGYVLYVPASDIISLQPIIGVVHRYVITALTVIDIETIDFTMVWDEPGIEIDSPTNGSTGIISRPTKFAKLGLPVDDGLYPNIPYGASISALDLDIQNIIDPMLEQLNLAAQLPQTKTYVHRQSTPVTSWEVTHNCTSLDHTFTITTTDGELCWPNKVETVDENTIIVHFLSPMVGKIVVVFA